MSMRVDGSFGEGGGQVLRTTLALAAVLGREVEVFNIRANRPKPGLGVQHAHGARALALMCGGRVEGAVPGSKLLRFTPGGTWRHEVRADTGTAASISLLIQLLLLPAVFAPHQVTLRLCGGTDVRWAPSIDYVAKVLLRVLGRMGVDASLRVDARGYYPQGGGRVRLRVNPARVLESFRGGERGRLVEVGGIAHASRLPGHVVERMSAAACRVLEEYSPKVEQERGEHPSRGAGITLWGEFERTTMGACALGEPGKRAELVGAEAAQALLRELRSDATVDVHLADQLVPFMALARGTSVFLVREVSSHLRTNLRLVEQLLEAGVAVEEEGGVVRVEIEGVGYENPHLGG